MNKDLKFVSETFTKTDGTVATAFICDNAGVELVSFGKARERVNGKGETKTYYIGSAKFTRTVAGQDVTKQIMCLINGANFDYGVEKGITYRTRIISTKDTDPLFVMSHLPITEKLDNSFFADLFSFDDIAVAVDLKDDLVGTKKK